MAGRPQRVLTRRDLNRATLARQMLLRREPLAVADAIERLAGLQAQTAMAPYVGLWTRLAQFDAGQLTQLCVKRHVVRAPLMRHTLHLMTSGDFVRLRTAIQPALTRSWRGITGKRIQGLDVDEVVSAARRYVGEEPRRYSEIQAWLGERHPDRDPSALSYTARSLVPMIQLASETRWGYAATAPYALAEDWLGEPPDPDDAVADLVRRYLAAFGPASVRDAQTWSGRAGLKPAIDELRPELATFRDEGGTELFDLPDAPRPPADTPAPPRLLPDYDNLVLSHADRTRVLSEEHRPLVSQRAGRVVASFLVDGFVAGTWKLDGKTGAVELHPFGRLARADRTALEEEAARVGDFIAAA